MWLSHCFLYLWQILQRMLKKHLMSHFIFSHLPGSSQSSACLFPPLRLLWKDTEVFTSQSRGAISPACPRSALWSCPSWTFLKYLIWEACWSPNSVWSWVDGLANVWFKELLWWSEESSAEPGIPCSQAWGMGSFKGHLATDRNPQCTNEPRVFVQS